MKKVLKLISRAFWAKNKQFGALNSISRLKSSAIHYLMIKSPGETTFAYVLVRFFGWANSKRHSRKYFSGHNLQHLMDDSFFLKGNVLKNLIQARPRFTEKDLRLNLPRHVV